MAEFYDEVVFTDPYEEFYTTLMQGQRLLPQRKHEHQEHFSTFNDGDTLQRLAAAREWVHNELRGMVGYGLHVWFLSRMNSSIVACKRYVYILKSYAVFLAVQDWCYRSLAPNPKVFYKKRLPVIMGVVK